MSGGIYPKAKALVPGILRSLSAFVLILIASACVYLSFAATEAPRDVWWKFWTDLRRRGALLLARGGMAAPGEPSRGLTPRT